MKVSGSIVVDDNQAAEELGLAVQTLRNWRCQCKGPAYIKLGRRIVYQLSDIEKYKLINRIDPEKRRV